MKKGVETMKRLFVGLLLASCSLLPLSALAQVNVNIGIGLPPPITFTEQPDVVVIPDTNYVYVVPDLDIDLFFWNGWWWRPWQGRWYRSRYYDRGWVYYQTVPSFYYDVDPGWRRYYRDRTWYGHPWYYERISQQRLHKNWKRWNENRHWERHQTWGVQGYKARPPQQRNDLRRERQREYNQSPDMRRHQEQQRQERRTPQQMHQPQPHPQQHQMRQPSQRSGPPGKPERD